MPCQSDLPDLIARVESAPPEMERPLLEEARELLCPEPIVGDYVHDEDAWNLWVETVRDPFDAKLDAGAGLCAAMMLLKPGWVIFHLGGPFEGPIAHATICRLSPDMFCEGTASTLTLALLAARLKQEVERG